MDLNNNIKRRAVASKRRSDKDRIAATDGVPNHQLYPAEVGQDTAERNDPKHKRPRPRQQFSKLSKKQSPIDRYLRHDREKIVFLFLAILGAAVVVIVCFTFSIAFEKGDTSGTAFGRVLERLPFLSNIRNNESTIKKHEIAQSATNRIGNSPHHAEFQETMPTYFVETEGDMHLKRPRLDDDDTILKGVNDRDFGGLDLEVQRSENMGTTRQIRHDSMRMQSDFRDYRTVERDDDQDNYYAFDDDFLRDPFTQSYAEDDELEEVHGHSCRRISEHRLYFPNCNSFHETPLLESGATHIGAGTYRQAMRIEISFAQEKETIVVKDIHLSNNLDYKAYEFTRMDAIVAERLTASSRIYAIYGTCGIGIMSEYFPHGTIEEMAIPEDDIDDDNDDDGPLICYNDLSGLLKLEISLHMAEALAELHGYLGGAIIHQDIKLDQFFLNANESEVVLNDFNRAEFLLWDERNGEYCGQRQGYGSGNWRSPEEYYDEFLNEKVDVYSLGNNMYGLLTGLMVFHHVYDYEEVQHLVAKGVKPYIDPRYKERSLAEAKLVEIIEKCHEYYETDRPSIFEVVDFLWQALEEVNDTRGQN